MHLVSEVISVYFHVTGPNSIAKCNIEPDNAGRYSVSYIPVESGVYVIHVKWNGRPVPGRWMKTEDVNYGPYVVASVGAQVAR